MGFAMSFVTIELKAGGVLPHSDGSLIFFFLMLFTIATTTFCFLISALFSKASSAASGAGILWFLSYFPFLVAEVQYPTLSYSSKVGFCAVSTTCMALGAKVIATQEGNGIGVTWSNAFEAISVDDSFSMGSVLGMLVLDSLSYFLLCWYLEHVWPGDVGVGLRWDFFAYSSFWLGADSDGWMSELARRLPGSGSRRVRRAAVEGARETDDVALLGADDGMAATVELIPAGENFEAEPLGLEVGIQLQRLRKVYGKKVAVHGSDLTLFRGQVFALLGHNGAGKTTTMAMLTGLLPPSSGTAIVHGHDICQNLSAAQQSLGVCPQHDVLFDSLTVEEHLIFFCTLKGVCSTDIKGHVDEMIDSLALSEKRHARSATLSGGQKRRLSCGIALVGGSKVVILDEPTSGMDPSARRATWDLISKYRSGRTILLSTHFMDEADVLGDRVGIMSDGVIQCCGSPLFLKRRFGAGYSLTMLRDPTRSARAADVHDFVKARIEGAALQSDIGAEVSFLLPSNSAPNFAGLFEALDAEKCGLGISSYGCSVTTMEEVFLKVGEGARAFTANADDGVSPQGVDSDVTGSSGHKIDIEARIKARQASAVAAHTNRSRTGVDLGSTRRYVGWALKWRQCKALITKRYKTTLRSRWVTASQLIPPLFFTLLSLVLAQTFFDVAPSPPRSLVDLKGNYGPNTAWVAGQSEAVVANSTRGTNSGLPSIIDVPGQTLLTLNSSSGCALGVSECTVSGIEGALALQAVTGIGGAAERGTPAATFEFFRRATVLLQLDVGSPIGWFNGEGFHAIAEALTLVESSLVNSLLGGEGSVTVVNRPLPLVASEVHKQQQQEQAGFNIAFSVLFGMAPLASSFLIVLVKERATKSKHVQFVSGVDPASFWASAFVWDFCCFMIPSIGCWLLFAAFEIDAYIGERFGTAALLFILYGLSVLPLMYLAAAAFMSPSIAFTRMTLFNIATGLVAMLAVTILENIESAVDTAVTIRSVFLFLPNFCFGQGLADLYSNYQAIAYATQYVSQVAKAIGLDGVCQHDPSKCSMQALCDLALKQAEAEANGGAVQPPCPSFNPDYLGWEIPGVGKYLCFMAIEAVAFFGALLLLEYRFFHKFRASLRMWWSGCRGYAAPGRYVPLNQPIGKRQTDDDVLSERERVRERSQEDDEVNTVVLEDLTKVFRPGGKWCSLTLVYRRNSTLRLAFAAWLPVKTVHAKHRYISVSSTAFSRWLVALPEPSIVFAVLTSLQRIKSRILLVAL